MSDRSISNGSEGRRGCRRVIALFGLLAWGWPPDVWTGVVFETYSPYHHIQVVDQGALRILSFDGSQETRMSLANPLAGHFEYTESFHLPWVWNPEIARVLMLGLGGGSTQRAYQYYYPTVAVDTAELDPTVVRVAQTYFGVKESPTLKIFTEDGRVFLRRTQRRYDVIIVDAYTTGRYGPAIPPHLASQEFFALAAEHLTTNGVLAYNAIGTLRGYQSGLVAALYKTMHAVFPQVYLFPARESLNVVLVATKASERFDPQRLLREGQARVRAGKVRLPTFAHRLAACVDVPPAAAAGAPLLRDDYAPVEGLLGGGLGRRPPPRTPRRDEP